jgi:GT2 family glycosyltransferase
MTKPSIAAVVVTCNRLALLQECVGALRAQTRKLDEIIVVDNASSDGTAEWLAKQTDLQVVTQANLGSAGGQSTGIKTAYLHGHDWFWCMDDDTVPHPEALEKFVVTPYVQDPATGFLGSLVLWTDGTPHRMNQPSPIQHWRWYNTVLADRCVRVDGCTFVSVLVSRQAVAAVGLPLKEFFIWCDDIEYFRRIVRRFNGYCVLDSVVVHKTKVHTGGVPVDQVSEADCAKYCYGLRNYIVTIKLQDASLGRRGYLIAKAFFDNVSMVLRGRAPARILVWMVRGLVFHPKPEMVQ